MIGGGGHISFRRLQAGDFPLMVKWLNAPHVNKVWDKKVISLEDVEKKYLPRIQADSKVAPYVALLDAQPIGYLQAYMVDDYPEYKKTLQVEGRTAGVDVFIGEEEMVGKGLGREIVRRFVEDVVFQEMPAELVVMGPNPSNAAAIKAYGKAGFVYLKTVYNAEENEEEYLMVKRRVEE